MSDNNTREAMKRTVRSNAPSSRNTTRMLCEGAALIAWAEILGQLKLGHLPNGGSVSLMMLPIVVFALRWGLTNGLLAGFALGVLDFMLDGGIAIGWPSILLDYIVACTLIGLAGLGSRKGLPGIVCGSILGCLGRFVGVLLSGALIWKEYMPEVFLGIPMDNPWFYSFLYNGITVGVSAIVTVIVVVLLYSTALRRYLLAEDIQR